MTGIAQYDSSKDSHFMDRKSVLVDYAKCQNKITSY